MKHYRLILAGLIIDQCSNIKDGYKLELQANQTMKLFGSTKELLEEIKNGEKVPSLEVVDVVLVQCNLVYNQYQQNIEPSNQCF